MTDKKAWGITTETLFAKQKWQGLLRTDLDYYLDLIRSGGEFRPRSEVEEDPTFKQIIPQIVFRHEGKYLLHRISESGSEARLHNLWPIFVGGHVDEIDAGRSDIIEAALHRELEEEVTINGAITSREFLGIIYIEDDNPVNHVHIGLCYLFDLDTDQVRSNEEQLADLSFVELEFLQKNIDQLTYWSRVVVKDVLSV